MSQKIKIRDVKSGKISQITPEAWNQLKKGGFAKKFDVLDQPTVNVVNAQVNKPIIENKIVEVETKAAEIVDEQPSFESPVEDEPKKVESTSKSKSKK